MKENSSATTPSRIAPRRTRRLLSVIARALLAAWREGVYVNELMLQRPWEQEGPLRWRRDARGWFLLGAQAPELPGVPDGAAPRPARNESPAQADDGDRITRRSG